MNSLQDRRARHLLIGRALRRSLRLMGDRRPILDGAITVAGIAGDVLVRRDAHGVPHITAPDEVGAWFGLGFAVGQDRSFQLEFYRRAVSGSLAAALGPAALRADQLARRIGFARAARSHLQVLDAPTVLLLESYASGLTAGMESGRRRRAHELALLGVTPARWTGVDVLAFVKLITASLGTNWDTELARSVILSHDGEAALAAADLGGDHMHPTTAGGLAEAVASELLVDLDHLRRHAPAFGASNCWVVDGAQTANGSPIIANDPHLNPQVPNQWYLAHVRCPEWECEGLTLVGAPGFVAGHNGHVAWGVTSSRADLSDLVVEELSEDRRSVRRGDDVVPCTVIDEVIRVRGRAPVVERVLVTPTGPIISPVLRDEPSVVSLRATWLEEHALRGFFDAGPQTTASGLLDCFRSWNGPSLNVLAADAEGHVAWHLVGTVPDRPEDPRPLPSSGPGGAGGWADTPLAFDQLPSSSDPPDGRIVNANNRPAAGPAVDRLGSEWADGYRARRLHQLLASRDDWTADDIAAIQLDVHAGPWDDLRDLVLAHVPVDPDATVALGHLREWSGRLDVDSVGASVYELMLFHLRRRVARHTAPRSWPFVMGEGVHDLAASNGLFVRSASLAVSLLRDRPDGVIDGEWDALLDQSLADAVGELRRRFGDDGSAWRWGAVRDVRVQHLLGDVPFLGPCLGLGPWEVGGDLNSVAMCAPDPRSPFAPPTVTPTFRMVVEVGRWEDARFALCGGQSGDPTSEHYDDQVEAFRDATGLRLAWSEEDVAWATRHTLRLVPAG